MSETRGQKAAIHAGLTVYGSGALDWKNLSRNYALKGTGFSPYGKL
jgi:hypothetical protein